MASQYQGLDLCGRPLVNQDNKTLDPETVQSISCIKCCKILKSPHQLSCGDRICQGCLPLGTFSCPKCQESISSEEVFSDKSCQLELQKLLIVCACNFSCPLKDWENHCQGCSQMSGSQPSEQEMPHVQRLEKHCMMLEQQVKDLREELQELKREPTVAVQASVDGTEEYVEKDQPLSVKLNNDIKHHKSQIAHLLAEVEKLSKEIPRFEAIIGDLNLKLEILEVKTISGSYVWKVNDITRRYKEAREGKTSSLYSPPFYTSQHGYRLCLRAYLNGDGSGKGTHISLFIVLMKGEFDDLLSWPFRHRVTLTLINQDAPTEPRSSKSQRFLPNPDSSSFRKPKEAFNIASGFPEFVPASVLHDSSFVKNDILYIKVKVDSNPASDVTGPDQVSYS